MSLSVIVHFVMPGGNCNDAAFLLTEYLGEVWAASRRVSRLVESTGVTNFCGPAREQFGMTASHIVIRLRALSWQVRFIPVQRKGPT